MDKQVHWGIIGCGDVTEIKSGPAFYKVPHSSLVAVMRRDAEKAKDYAQRHHVKKWYSNSAELIYDNNVTAVYIATPPLYHEEYTIEALKAGKPVYVEKPMAVSALAAARMADVSRQTGVKLCVAHYRRQQPLFLKIKSLLEQNTIGEVRSINLQLLQPHRSELIAQTEEAWRLNPAISGGGLFHDLAPHQLDLMLYFFGTPLYAKGIALNASRFYDADDTVSGMMLFEKNILFTGSWCFTAGDRTDRCEITGSKGSIHFSIFDHQPLQVIIEGKTTNFEFEKLQHVQQPMIQKVTEYFLGIEPNNPCTAEEGLTVMQMIDSFSARV